MIGQIYKYMNGSISASIHPVTRQPQRTSQNFMTYTSALGGFLAVTEETCDVGVDSNDKVWLAM